MDPGSLRYCPKRISCRFFNHFVRQEAVLAGKPEFLWECGIRRNASGTHELCNYCPEKVSNGMFIAACNMFETLFTGKAARPTTVTPEISKGLCACPATRTGARRERVEDEKGRQLWQLVSAIQDLPRTKSSSPCSRNLGRKSENGRGHRATRVS
jgi:hypothetical protein